MNRKQTLVKNIFIFGLGTSLSKLMSVLLVGLYTAYIGRADFGYYDILITTVSALAPLISLQITDALYRSLLESPEDSGRPVTNAFFIILSGLCLSTAVLTVVNLAADIRFGWLLPGYFATSILLVFSQQTARGLKHNTVYAVSGIIYTGVMLLANILLIVVCGMGVEALLYSTMLADVVGIIYIEITVGAFRKIQFRLLSREHLKKMCRYSVPLLPNVVTWWLLMVVNRYAIRYFAGEEVNGLFAAASKFPALLMTVYGIFALAWQENAILEYEAEDRNEYYTKTFGMYLRLLSGAILLLLPATRFIVSILINEEYYDAWRFIPFLYVGSMLQAFANFYATVYMGVKKTMGAFVTMVIGVAGGVVICLTLMPEIGAQAAALAHMTAFLLAWLLRVRHTRKYAHIRLDLRVLLAMTVLCGGFIVCYFLENPLVDAILFVAAIPVFLLLNKELIVMFFNMAKDFIMKR